MSSSDLTVSVLYKGTLYRVPRSMVEECDPEDVWEYIREVYHLDPPEEDGGGFNRNDSLN